METEIVKISEVRHNSVERDNILFEYENISVNQMVDLRSGFHNSDQIRHNNLDFNKGTNYGNFKSDINNSVEVNEIGRNIGCNRRGGKLKPRHVPDFVLISPDDVDKMLSSVTSHEERKTIMNNYELGIVVLRRLCISESSEIKAFMDSIQMRTTGKALESHERNIICLTFKGQPKRWVFCPCRGCLFKGKAHDKLMGHFKIMEQDAQSNKFHISKNVFDSYGVFMASCGYFAATFCPQQNYSSHKVFVGPTISDLKGRIHDRYILYVNDAKVIQMAWRRKQNYSFDCEELLSNVMSKLLVCSKSNHGQIISQLNKGYTGLISLPLKLHFHDSSEKRTSSMSPINEIHKRETVINKKNKRKLSKRHLEDWNIINSEKFLNDSSDLQNVYHNKGISPNIASKSSFSFPDSPLVKTNSRYFNGENNSITPRCTRQYIPENSHEIDNEMLASTNYNCLVGDVSTAAATPVIENTECVVNRQFNYNSKILDCIQSINNLNRNNFILNDKSRNAHSNAFGSLETSSVASKAIPLTSTFINNNVNQGKMIINEDLRKMEYYNSKIFNRNWSGPLESENNNPNVKQNRDYSYGDFSQNGTLRQHMQQGFINDGVGLNFNPLVFSSDSASNSILASETIEEESINKSNFNNNGFSISGISSNSSLSIYRQVFSPNEITPNSTLEISSPVRQISHAFISDGIIQDQSSQINLIQQVQNIVNPGTYNDVFGDEVAQCTTCEHCSMDEYPYYCNCYKISSGAASNSNVMDVNDASGVFELNNQYIHTSHEVDS